MIVKESNFCSISKAVSWLVLATINTLIIIYIILRELKLTLLADILESIIKILSYWFHERVWLRLDFGSCS